LRAVLREREGEGRVDGWWRGEWGRDAKETGRQRDIETETRRDRETER